MFYVKSIKENYLANILESVMCFRNRNTKQAYFEINMKMLSSHLTLNVATLNGRERWLHNHLCLIVEAV